MTGAHHRLNDAFHGLDDELSAGVPLPSVDAVIGRAGALNRASTAAAIAVLAVGALGGVTAVAHADGALSRKQKELIAIAASILKGCERCISYHVRSATAAGATSDEMVEAGFVAVIMDGGPALAHMGSLLDAIEAHREESP